MTKFHFKTGVPYYAYHHNNRLTTSRLVNISNKLHNIFKNFAKKELIKAAYKLDHWVLFVLVLKFYSLHVVLRNYISFFWSSQVYWISNKFSKLNNWELKSDWEISKNVIYVFKRKKSLTCFNKIIPQREILQKPNKKNSNLQQKTMK